jgi:hypothetical protein
MLPLLYQILHNEEPDYNKVSENPKHILVQCDTVCFPSTGEPDNLAKAMGDKK